MPPSSSTNLLSRLDRSRADAAARDEHPWIRVLERAGLPPDGVTISTNTIAVLLGISATTGNARKIAGVMRLLGFQPILSRKLIPGGWQNTLSRGWVRPGPDFVRSEPGRPRVVRD